MVNRCAKIPEADILNIKAPTDHNKISPIGPTNITKPAYTDCKLRIYKLHMTGELQPLPGGAETALHVCFDRAIRMIRQKVKIMANLSEIREQSAKAAEAVCEAAHLRKGDLFVVGCSTSEVVGGQIGTNSSLEAAEAVFEGIHGVLHKRGIFLAAQCCEHLNRALIVEREACEKFDLEEVNVIPQPKAGGSFGTTAYRRFADPVAVESLRQKASAGMDVGCTLIGMHIKPVVVPLRIPVRRIGEAVLVCARRRPKFVGGERAVYNEELM